MRLLAILLAIGCVASVRADDPPQRDPSFVGTPFERYTCKDRFHRTITFYLSRPTPKPVPIALLIQGSGGQSIWTVKDGRVRGSLQNLAYAAARNRFRVLAVEKPGVEFGFMPKTPGEAEGCSEAFLREHTLDRWAEANSAALKAARALPGVDLSRCLVIGHSEGGIVAARVAADNRFVTHVASLSGGGPTQLFDMSILVGRDEAFENWRKIQSDPDSIAKFAWGHPYRRWSSFLRTSTIEELLKSQAKIYLAHGTEDTSSPIEGFDILRATLASKGRNFTFERIEGAGHSLGPPGKGFEGMKAVLNHVADWFLAQPVG